MQVRVALELAGAPRRFLFDEPAAGPSPAERRDLVEIFHLLPACISFIIIKHDLDVALHVSSQVTMMHNCRIFKEGTPEKIENDPQVEDIRVSAAMRRLPTQKPCRTRVCDRPRTGCCRSSAAAMARKRPRSADCTRLD